VIAPGVTDFTGDERRLRMLLDGTDPHDRPDVGAERARAKRVEGGGEHHFDF
jgi:hypothetical protein